MSTRRPVISVVVPCRNEAEHIETCVASLLSQEPPPGDFEVIIADGMSTDGTREILARLSREHTRLRVVDNPRKITPCAMNAGITAARGDYIAIMGAHSRYASDYLVQCLKTIEERGADNVGGAMLCEGHTRVQKAIAAAHHSPFSVGGARWHDPDYEGPADTLFGGFYRKEVFERIGMLDEQLVRNQDDELNLRLSRAGGKIWHSPRIHSWYTPRSSLSALFRQYFQYGYWKVRVIQKHKIPASVRHVIPGLFVLSLLLGPLVGLLWWPLFLLWLLMVAVYVVADLVASAFAAARNGWDLFPLLLLIFPTYHLAYGYGFLRGVLDFVLLRRQPSSSSVRLTRAGATPGLPSKQ